MTRFDLSPLFRSTVGYDYLDRLFDTALNDEAVSYPPYNIEKTGEDAYRVTMAVAGFSPEELSIVQQANSLVVTGKSKDNGGEKQYLFRGLAGRAFERRFQLADHIKVAGADLKNGLLAIDLVREVPEAMRPRQIKIENGVTQKVAVDAKAA